MIVGFAHTARRLRMTEILFTSMAAFAALANLHSKAVFAAGPTSQPASNATILNQPMGEISFQSQRLDDVLDSVRSDVHAGIYVNWPALDRASVHRDALVTVHVHNAKLSEELEAIFKSVEEKEDESKLRYMLDGETLTITTQRDFDEYFDTRRYDVKDLLPGNEPREKEVSDLEKYVMDHVATAKWKVNGGDTHFVISASDLAPVLLITQTPDNQKKIEELFKDLRANPGMYRASPGI